MTAEASASGALPQSGDLASAPLAARVARHFFVHSGHVPLVLMILEALLARPGYFSRPDPYVLLAAGVFQAWVAEGPMAGSRARRAAANLAGPLVYSLIEWSIEGNAFFAQWHHQAYWVYAAAFAVLQALPERASGVVAESVVRSSVPLVLYALFEARLKSVVPTFEWFFADAAHAFLAVVLVLLGLLLGLADWHLRTSLATIAALTARLRRYSQWALGAGVLGRAMSDERVLSLQRVDRAVLFMDIRGFTAWSEQQTPEAVVALLNRYYAAAEACAVVPALVKLKYTADEVMAVFSGAGAAMQAGSEMLRAVAPVLAAHGLGAGCGVHQGLLVEGVLGGTDSKAYDFIGDTVNTAQRLCDAAGPGELLATLATCRAAGHTPREERAITAKGKREPLAVGVMAV